MSKDIWQSKENPNEFFGTNEDLTEFNKAKGGTLLVENQQAFEMFSKGEPLVIPSTLSVKNEPKKKEKKKNTKVVNIAATQNGKDITIQVKQAEAEAPMTMPPVILQENQLGYSSPSLIKTGSEDPQEKMRECGTEQEENEEGNPMPKVVSEEK